MEVEQPIQVIININDDPLSTIFGGRFDWSKYPNYGWPDPKPGSSGPRVQLPEGTSETPRTGKPVTQVPEDPVRPGINPSEGGIRPGATRMERFKVGGAMAFRIIIRIFFPGIIIVDAIGPVLLPYTIGVCARRPQACDPNSTQSN